MFLGNINAFIISDRLRFTNVKSSDHMAGRAYACMAMNSIMRKSTQGRQYFVNTQGGQPAQFFPFSLPDKSRHRPPILSDRGCLSNVALRGQCHTEHITYQTCILAGTELFDHTLGQITEGRVLKGERERVAGSENGY